LTGQCIGHKDAYNETITSGSGGNFLHSGHAECLMLHNNLVHPISWAILALWASTLSVDLAFRLSAILSLLVTMFYSCHDELLAMEGKSHMVDINYAVT
jgi:hypothetical protein